MGMTPAQFRAAIGALRAVDGVLESKTRHVRDADFWGAPVGTPLPLPAKYADKYDIPVGPIDAPALLGAPRVELVDGRLMFVERLTPMDDREPERTPVEWLYRSISEDEWQSIQDNGYIQSDGRMNLAEWEGTCAATRDPSFYLPFKIGERGRIIKFRYDPADEWWIDSDGYAKTNARIPAERIVQASPWYIKGKPEADYSYSDLMEDTFGLVSNGIASLTDDYRGPNADFRDAFYALEGDVRKTRYDDRELMTRHAYSLEELTDFIIQLDELGKTTMSEEGRALVEDTLGRARRTYWMMQQRNATKALTDLQDLIESKARRPRHVIDEEFWDAPAGTLIDGIGRLHTPRIATPAGEAHYGKPIGSTLDTQRRRSDAAEREREANPKPPPKPPWKRPPVVDPQLGVSHEAGASVAVLSWHIASRWMTEDEYALYSSLPTEDRQVYYIALRKKHEEEHRRNTNTLESRREVGDYDRYHTFPLSKSRAEDMRSILASQPATFVPLKWSMIDDTLVFDDVEGLDNAITLITQACDVFREKAKSDDPVVRAPASSAYTYFRDLLKKMNARKSNLFTKALVDLQDLIETKQRNVATAAGERRYGAPIGTPLPIPAGTQLLLPRMPTSRVSVAALHDEHDRLDNRPVEDLDSIRKGARHMQALIDEYHDTEFYDTGRSTTVEDRAKFTRHDEIGKILSDKYGINVYDYDEGEGGSSSGDILVGGSAWIYFGGCRDIREAAYDMLGFDAYDRGADPHLQGAMPTWGNGSSGESQPSLMAYALLDKLKDADRTSIPIYRGVDLQGRHAGGFVDDLKENPTFDLPLASFAGNKKSVSRFGNDIVFEVLPGARHLQGGFMGDPDADEDSDDYEPLDYYDEQSAEYAEIVTGGRFKVVRVKEVGESVIVTIKQVAVFDPATGMSQKAVNTRWQWAYLFDDSVNARQRPEVKSVVPAWQRLAATLEGLQSIVEKE